MISVYVDPYALPNNKYRVWYDRYFPLYGSFTKQEAVNFALDLHARKTAERKAYGFSPPTIVLYCPPEDVADLRDTIKTLLPLAQEAL